MRLSSIEALRYGALEGACLDGISDGLTVILGPNESGKSTLTALTRHVLYGFVDGRAKEANYQPAAGTRAARLVFADDSGEWAIERVEGKNRGPFTVTARRGVERSGLLGELVSGVSEQSYRVVFGFGLDEMAAIESSDSAEIVARLYAAGTGLSVNPIDARRTLEASAASLWAPRAQKPAVNALASGIRDCRDRLRVLEAAAANYAAEQVRASELAERLVPLRERVGELEVDRRTLERDTTRMSDAQNVLAEMVQAAADITAEIADLERSLEMLDIDERVVAVAPRLSAVLEETSAFRERIKAIDSFEAEEVEATRRANVDESLPADAIDSVANRSEVETRRDQLTQYRADVASSQRAAEQAEAHVSSIERASADVEEAATPAPRSRAALALAVLAFVTGAAAIAAGVILEQFVAVGLGVFVLLAGIIALTVVLVRKPQVSSEQGSLTAEVARARADRDTAVSLAQGAQQRLDSAIAQWRAWLGEQHLDAFGEDPVAVRQLLEAVAQRQRSLSDARRASDEATRARDAAEAWVVRLVDLMRGFDPSAGQLPALSAGLEFASRARVAIERVRAAEDERTQISRQLDATVVSSRKIAERLEATRAVIAEVAARHGLPPEDALPELQAVASAAGSELAALREELERASTEHARLRGVLDTEGHDRHMALARQELEGLRAQAEQAADRYVVATLAVRLLDRARERFESERQPEVVRTAGRVFSAMTKGRYTDVRVPMDGTGVTVLASDGTVRGSDQLSRGTAEQLYLALRIGLIGSLGATGSALPVLMDDVVVNFDPERREGAVRAIAELAAMRQVLFFTCHPETAAALAASVSGAAVLSLDRCALR